MSGDITVIRTDDVEPDGGGTYEYRIQGEWVTEAGRQPRPAGGSAPTSDTHRGEHERGAPHGAVAA